MAEAAELRKLLPEMESKVELLEREVEFLKKDKSENEEKTRDLEKKIGALEKKDVDERNKLTRIEEELRGKIQEKEMEVLELRQKTKEVESFAKFEELGYGGVDTVNGGVNENGVISRDGKGVKCLKVQLPVVAVGSTVVAATAMIWFYFGLIHENNDDDGFLYGLMFIKPVNFDFLLKS
ncbi:hypothetical protein HN51_047950 [Arachis hypogaea]|uniref:Uncharacterized protein n=1 Tax=Arachis hypogaea TaxID=3818 RepID=A0A445AIX8_ARAHY|nr:uncharacterized protein LOC107627494 [Arachis ipaensis]XP_025636140.1 uncharacterized protein LOC112730262 [Arachis hypogaea]RYR26355.1 hypothetical protein Ahy_B02g060589 [Arachis hypogaea]